MLRHFIAALVPHWSENAPWDRDTATVFADWCEEQGAVPLAEALRGDPSPELRFMMEGLGLCVGVPMTGAYVSPSEETKGRTAFGEALKRLRQAAGYSSEALADALSADGGEIISSDRIKAWERGSSRPHSRNRVRLMTLFPELEPYDRDIFEHYALRKPPPRAPASRSLTIREDPVPNTGLFGESLVWFRVTESGDDRSTQVSLIACLSSELPSLRLWVARHRTVRGVRLPVNEVYSAYGIAPRLPRNLEFGDRAQWTSDAFRHFERVQAASREAS